MTAGRRMTCEERIAGELAETERSVSGLWQRIGEAAQRGDGQAEEEAREELAPLSLETKRVLKVLFSWGGPSDWLEAELDGYEVVSLTYHFADWFDHAERDVSEHAAPGLWRLAAFYAEYAELYER